LQQIQAETATTAESALLSTLHIIDVQVTKMQSSESPGKEVYCSIMQYHSPDKLHYLLRSNYLRCEAQLHHTFRGNREEACPLNSTPLRYRPTSYTTLLLPKDGRAGHERPVTSSILFSPVRQPTMHTPLHNRPQLLSGHGPPPILTRSGARTGSHHTLREAQPAMDHDKP
jgi:hypothetical protein